MNVRTAHKIDKNFFYYFHRGKKDLLAKAMKRLEKCYGDKETHRAKGRYKKVRIFVRKTLAEALDIPIKGITRDLEIACPCGIYVSDSLLYSIRTDIELEFDIGLNDFDDLTTPSDIIYDVLTELKGQDIDKRPHKKIKHEHRY